MKIALSNGEEIEVEFQHFNSAKRVTIMPGTNVIVKCQNATFVGRSRVHPHDQYSKIVGRKIALRQALENQPREIRREIWMALIEKGMRVA